MTRKNPPRAGHYGGGLWFVLELEDGQIVDGVMAQSELLADGFPQSIRLQVSPGEYQTFARAGLKRAQVLSVIGPIPTAGTKALRKKARTLKPS